MNKKKSNGPQKAKNRIRKQLLSLLYDNPTKVYNFKQIRSKLSINSAVDQVHLENAIGQLAHERKIEIENNSKVRLVATEREKRKEPAILGTLDLAKSGVGFVICENFEQDIFIYNKNLLNAFPGDTVRVELSKNEKGKRPEGKIVEVMARGKDVYPCLLQVHESFAFALPMDKKMPVDFFIPPTQFNGAKDGEIVSVKLINFNPDENNPVGRVAAVLGKAGEHSTEMNAIMLNHNLPATFPLDVQQAAEQISEEITERDIKERKDYREVLTFTIDPWDAKDFDDAISFQRLDNGDLEIGVHIADVSHYVRPGSILDKEAQKRATSVYLVDRVIPMLPERLSNQLCSLRPNEDKCCFSIIFTMTEKAEVKSQWIGRTLIHSDRRFSYEEAQERIESGDGDLALEIRTVNELAKKLRAKRFTDGAVSFDREEMRFKLDEKGNPTEIVIKTSKDAHKLIEEFMLLANKEVSKNYLQGIQSKTKLPFVYRVHDKPDPKKIEGLQKMIARFGYDIDLTSDEKSISKGINYLLEASKGKVEHNMLATLSIRSMAKAKYTTKNAGHFGLSFDHYSHFTSPIRRYPDVMAHRLLAQYAMGYTKVEAAELEDLCTHSSAMEVEAEQAERDSTKFKMVEYMQQFVGEEMEGKVNGVTDHTLFVELSNHCEGSMRLSSLIDDHYYFDDENYRVIGQNTRKSYSLGQDVKVRVVRCDLDNRVVELDMLSDSGQKEKKVKPPKAKVVAKFGRRAKRSKPTD